LLAHLEPDAARQWAAPDRPRDARSANLAGRIPGSKDLLKDRARWCNHPIWEIAPGEINTDLFEMHEGSDPDPVKEVQRWHHIGVLLKNIKASTITLAALEGIQDPNLERFFHDTATRIADPAHTAKQLRDARDRYTFITPANRDAPPDRG
jgi:hypothetical protein